MSWSSEAHILAAMEAGGIVDNRTNAVAAFNHVGAAPNVGFTLAAVCAVLVSESNGRNIWGADPGGIALDPAWGLSEHPVTQADYTRYKLRRNEGYQPQGCGPCQLTSASLQIEAEHAGGCWRPLPNCIIGFEFLKGLFEREGSALAGFGAFNGSGAGGAYAHQAVARMEQFQAAFNAS